MTSGLMKLIGQGQSNGPVNGRADESTKPKYDPQNDVVSPRPSVRDNSEYSRLDDKLLLLISQNSKLKIDFLTKNREKYN